LAQVFFRSSYKGKPVMSFGDKAYRFNKARAVEELDDGATHLLKITVRAGHLIDQVAFHYSDGMVTSMGGNRVERLCVDEFALQDGEYFTAVKVREGDSLDAIQFETNLGRKTPMWGNESGGEPYTMAASDGNQIWRLENKGFCGIVRKVVERPVPSVPLMLSVGEKEGRLTITCGTMGNPSVAEFRNLTRWRLFAHVRDLIKYQVPPPIGRCWKLVLPDMTILNASHFGSTLGTLFGIQVPNEMSVQPSAPTACEPSADRDRLNYFGDELSQKRQRLN